MLMAMSIRRVLAALLIIGIGLASLCLSGEMGESIILGAVRESKKRFLGECD